MPKARKSRDKKSPSRKKQGLVTGQGPAQPFDVVKPKLKAPKKRSAKPKQRT